MPLIGPGNPAETALVRLAGKTDDGGFASGSRIGETAAPSRIDSKSAATSRSATPAPATGLEGPEQTGGHLCQGLAFAARSNRGGGDNHEEA
jgi:hypothetical protein